MFVEKGFQMYHNTVFSSLVWLPATKANHPKTLFLYCLTRPHAKNKMFSNIRTQKSRKIAKLRLKSTFCLWQSCHKVLTQKVGGRSGPKDAVNCNVLWTYAYTMILPAKSAFPPAKADLLLVPPERHAFRTNVNGPTAMHSKVFRVIGSFLHAAIQCYLVRFLVILQSICFKDNGSNTMERMRCFSPMVFNMLSPFEGQTNGVAWADLGLFLGVVTWKTAGCWSFSKGWS